ALQNLICCGAFDSLHPNRRQLLWALSMGMADGRNSLLFPDDNVSTLPSVPDFSPLEKFNMEYRLLGIDVRCHYMSLWRDSLDRRGFTSSKNLRRVKDGSFVKIAGLPVRPHRPPTRSGKIA